MSDGSVTWVLTLCGLWFSTCGISEGADWFKNFLAKKLIFTLAWSWYWPMWTRNSWKITLKKSFFCVELDSTLRRVGVASSSAVYSSVQFSCLEVAQLHAGTGSKWSLASITFKHICIKFHQDYLVVCIDCHQVYHVCSWYMDMAANHRFCSDGPSSDSFQKSRDLPSFQNSSIRNETHFASDATF